MFTGVDAFAVAGGLALVVIGAFLGFACIPRDVDTDRLGCSAMWHEPPLSDVAKRHTRSEHLS
jgi:hypothetical protein